MNLQEKLCGCRRNSNPSLLAALMVFMLLFAVSVCLPAENEWSRKTDMPTARGWLSTVVIDGKIYAVGGLDDLALATLEEYDPQLDRWTRKADMPTAHVNDLSTSVIEGKLYTIGRAVPNVEEYDPELNKWTVRARIPTERRDFTTSVVNGKIYAIGGNIRGGEFGEIPPIMPIEVYDPVTDEWEKKGDTPTPREGHCAAVVGGKIYIIGGQTTDGWVWEPPSKLVEEYDPVTGMWEEKASMPTARMNLTCSVVNGKIYVIGGWNRGVSFPTLEVYDPATDSWEKKKGMPGPRYAFASAAVNGKIYAIGGWTGLRGQKTVEEYDTGFDPSTVHKSVTAEGKLASTWGQIKTR